MVFQKQDGVLHTSVMSQCDVLTCEVWSLLLGMCLALFYVRIMFGVDPLEGGRPMYCAISVEPRACPLKIRQGSLYILGYRLHHWLCYTLLLPIVIFFQFYIGLGICLVMIVHGLWYEDRFQFEYSAPVDVDTEETIGSEFSSTEDDSFVIEDSL